MNFAGVSWGWGPPGQLGQGVCQVFRWKPRVANQRVMEGRSKRGDSSCLSPTGPKTHGGPCCRQRRFRGWQMENLKFLLSSCLCL